MMHMFTCFCYIIVVFRSVMFFFFFKQKTAYEMRISDWSSDVCSSDLGGGAPLRGRTAPAAAVFGEIGDEAVHRGEIGGIDERTAGAPATDEIGRASCRERVCQYV